MQEKLNADFNLHADVSFDVYYYRGWARMSLKDYKGALADFNKSIKLNSTEVGLYNSRAKAKENLGDKKGALEDYNRAKGIVNNANTASNEKHDFLIYYQRGFNELENGQNYDAINDFDNATILDPTSFEAFFNRGEAKYNIKNYRGAINDYNKAIELKAWPLIAVIIYYKRGLAKIAIGDKEGGCIDLHKSLKAGSRSAGEAINEYCK